MTSSPDSSDSQRYEEAINIYIAEVLKAAKEHGIYPTKRNRSGSFLRTALEKEIKKQDRNLIAKMKDSEIRAEARKWIESEIARQVFAKRNTFSEGAVGDVVDKLKSHHAKKNECLIIPFC